MIGSQEFGLATMKALAEKINGLRYSTAFSGIDAPGTALHMSLLQIRHRVASLGETLPPLEPPVHVVAFEWLRVSQRELNAFPARCGPQCLFADIAGIWRNVTWNVWDGWRRCMDGWAGPAVAVVGVS